MKKYLAIAIIAAILILPHIFSLTQDYLEIEWFYVQPAIELAKHGINADLSWHFATATSPILTSIILSGSYVLFGESPLVSRLTILVIGSLFALFLYFYLKRKEGVMLGFLATLFVVVNPLFILYAQFVCTDVPYMAFSSAAMLLLLYAGTQRENVLSSVMTGLALATKYVTIVLFPVITIKSFLTAKAKAIKFNAWYYAIVLVLSLPVILIAYRFLNGYAPLTRPQWFIPDLALLVPRFFAYLIWLGLFLGLFSIIMLLDLWQRLSRGKLMAIIAGCIVLTAIVTYFYPIPSLHRLDGSFGEMNLAGAENIVPERLLSPILFVVLLMAELIIISMAMEARKSRTTKDITLACWALLPVLFMSLTRGANRYMLTVLVPLSIYMAMVTKRFFESHPRTATAIVAAHSLLFVVVGAYAYR
ncbi:MAG: glycosyltransferase family 39 protein [Dehalococcoidales bacterium]|nr:glycosyltransferase family 39 protein [Dehalococcoidales bacterium]